MAELSIRLAGLHWHGLVLVLRLVQLPPSLFQVSSALSLVPRTSTTDLGPKCHGVASECMHPHGSRKHSSWTVKSFLHKRCFAPGAIMIETVSVYHAAKPSNN
jgi:hypothetical protein